MFTEFVSQISIIQLYMAASLIFVLVNSNKKKKIHRIVIYLILTSFLTEQLTSLCIVMDIHYGMLYTVGAIIINLFWWFLLLQFASNRRMAHILLAVYMVFALCNILFIEGYEGFNLYTFIIGAFSYIAVFMNENLINLRKENFAYFESNEAILLYAPIVLFFLTGFIMGFNNTTLFDVEIIRSSSLYEIIAFIGNFVYCTLMVAYIYREKKMSYGK
jgi:hypothetical protein